jgi:hypothetical protein
MIYRFERTIRTSTIIRTTSTLPFLASSYCNHEHASQLPRSRMFLCISTTTRPVFRHFHSHFHRPPIYIRKDSADLVGLVVAYTPSEDCSQSSGASSHNQLAGAAFRSVEIAYLVHRCILIISFIQLEDKR